jgi:hypothetical protein
MTNLVTQAPIRLPVWVAVDLGASPIRKTSSPTCSVASLAADDLAEGNAQNATLHAEVTLFAFRSL